MSTDASRRALCFVGTATTGTIPPWFAGGRRIWEIGLIRREFDGTERTSHLFIRRADVTMRDVPEEHLRRSLDAAGYHRRYPEAAGLPMDKVYSGEQAAQIVAAVTQGTYLVGLNAERHATSFTHLLHTYGLWHGDKAPWHGLPVDVTTEAGGALGLPLHRREAGDLAAALGVDLGPYTRHQALDDAAIARDLLDAAFARHGLDPLADPRTASVR